jgi:GTPase SAR1 family protein
MSLCEKSNVVLKIVFVGQASAGKTRLLNCIADDIFHKIYMASIGCDFKIRTYDNNGTKVMTKFLGTAGQERHTAISATYYKCTHVLELDVYAVILCYDLNDANTLDSLDFWLDQLVTY